MQISMKAARVTANYTQVQMAQMMGVTVGTVSNWEKDKCDISARQFARFCEIVGVSRDDILLPKLST